LKFVDVKDIKAHILKYAINKIYNLKLKPLGLENRLKIAYK